MGSRVQVEIDRSSGFCFGVINAIRKAEQELRQGGTLSSLGDIVHNAQEVKRLEEKGLRTISYDDLGTHAGSKVLFRAHGEPPKVYEYARQKGIVIIDASCPVVLKLQRRIKEKYEEGKDKGVQIVIYGKHGHAEVNGLVGQTEGNAIVVQHPEDLSRLDLSRPVELFSQTTMSCEGYAEVVEWIAEHLEPGVPFGHYDTICRQVSNRMSDIATFASGKDWIYFVAGQKSSNGKVLFAQAENANPHTYFISSATDIQEPLPEWVRTVGVCGATSTPMWLMEEVKVRVEALNPDPTAPPSERQSPDG